MPESIQHNSCPICGSSRIQKALMVMDHSVTKEKFFIFHCADCTARFTQQIPGEDAIGKYYQSPEYISHSETREGFVNAIYHRVKNRTLHIKRRLVENETGLRGGRLLDLGCGTGAFLHIMQLGGWQVSGVEPDAGARKLALTNYGLAIQPAEWLMQIPPQQFDAITLWHVLEHVHALHDYLEILKKILRPGGRIFIALPNYTSYDASVYQQYWAAYDVPRHLYHFSPASMICLLEQHHLQICGRKPMWYDSYYISLLSEKYRSGKSHALRAAINGAVSNLKAWNHVDRCSSVIYVVKC